MIQGIRYKIHELSSIEPDSIVINKIKAIPLNIKLTFVFSLLFVFIVHGFGFSNKFLNEDSIYYFRTSMLYLYNLGRWMLVFLQHIRGFYTAPWIIGVFAAIYLSLANAFIVSTLEIKSTINSLLISFMVVAYPAWANQFMYDYSADAYPAALLLAVLAIYITKKHKYGFVVGAVCLMLSLALYQAFLAFAIGVALLMIIKYSLENASKNIVIPYIIKFALCGILGLIFYLISVRVSLLITGGQLSAYGGTDSIGQLPLRELPSLLIRAYATFIQGFLVTGLRENWLYVSRGLFYLYALTFILMVYMLARLVISKNPRKIYTYIILAGCLLILPVGLNITEIMAPMALTHILVTNGFVLGIVLVFVILEAYWSRASFYLKCAVIILTMLVGANYWRQSSSFYFVQHIQYERTFAFYNRMLARIEGTEGYEPGMPVAIIGTAPFWYMGVSDVLAAESRQIVGFSEYRPAVGLGQPHKVMNFFSNYLGVHVVRANSAQVEQVMTSQEFFSMPLYPRYGSVQVIDDVLVVKLNVVYEHDINIVIDGHSLEFYVQLPFRRDGRVIAPVREVFEALGYIVERDNDTITITGSDYIFRTEIGDIMFEVDGNYYAFDIPPQMINDRSMFHVAAILERMGHYVKWDINTRTMYVIPDQ